MNKTLLTTALVFLALGSIRGARMEVGYCNGEVSETTASKVGKCTVSAAVILSPEILSPYKGASVKGVHLYLSTSEGVSDLSGWIRGTLEGENIDENYAAEALTGWQTIPLNGSYEIDGSPVVVGFSFSQAKSVKCITIAGDYNRDGLYVAKNNDWSSLSSNAGSICVELEIEGDMIPAKDLELRSLTTEYPIVKKGEDLIIEAELRNASLSVIEGFEYELKIGDYYSDKSSSSAVIQPKQVLKLSLPVSTSDFKADVPLSGMLTISTSGDEVESNNSGITSLAAYEESFKRRLLLEEFTTELCVNCPRAINTIGQAMADGYDEKMTVVAHHVGYNTDWLTLDEDEGLLWLYGNDGTFAPAVMLDRRVRNKDVLFPVESIGYYDTFGPRLEEALVYPSFVNVNVAPALGDNEIIVKVKAEAMPVFGILTENPRLTVVLTEDGIVHHSQAGISNPEFTHSHVTRAYLTSFDGELFNWNDNSLEWEGSIAINPEWVVENMEAVAFISNYNEEDPKDCVVFNTGVAHLADASVKDIESDSEIVSVEYFDVQGRKVSNPDAGLYIVRKYDSKGNISTDKKIFK
ncbi:MAG: Omp28-related outer membrane protein [Muribaculaceae bacterium]|nr:Omp28-related outer membrane protein [Muribaculaceae bacterium]